MAYTYDDFIKAANNAGLYNQFSAYDLSLAQANPDVGMGLLSAKQAWNRATDDAGRSAANQQAEQLRLSAGSYGQTPYTAGSWGLEYNPLTNGSAYNPTSVGNPTGSMVPQSGASTPSSFTPQTNVSGSAWDASKIASAYPAVTISPASNYDASSAGAAPKFNDRYTPQMEAQAAALNNYPAFTYSPYTDRYDADIQAARQEAFNRDPFNYDYATDPVYQAYAKQYRREGERSMQKTLAQSAALTGGVASSAATAAAQQANNYYNAQLADRIPQLYADAYNRYLQDYQMSQDKLNTLMRLSDTDYGRYDTNRKFDFNIYQDRYGQARDYFDALNTLYGNNFDQYQTQLDQYNKNRNFDFDVWAANEDNRRYVEEMQNKAALDQYNALLDLYGMGYDQEQAALDRAYNEEQDRLNWDYKYAALSNSGGGRSSGGSRSSSSGSNEGGDATAYTVEPSAVSAVVKENTSTPAAREAAYREQIARENAIPDAVPVYTDAYGDNIMATYTDEEIQRLQDMGIIRGVILPNGQYKYIYIGDVTKSKPSTARTAGSGNVRNRQESLN